MAGAAASLPQTLEQSAALSRMFSHNPGCYTVNGCASHQCSELFSGSSTFHFSCQNHCNLHFQFSTRDSAAWWQARERKQNCDYWGKVSVATTAPVVLGSDQSTLIGPLTPCVATPMWVRIKVSPVTSIEFCVWRWFCENVTPNDIDALRELKLKTLALGYMQITSIIPKRQVVASSVERLDPNKQLREAGYPFDHIGRELTDLQGKWEVVSSDVLLLKGAITDETKKLSDKVDDAQRTVLENVEHLFTRKFLQTAGAIIGCFSIMFGIVTFLKGHGITGTALG